MARKRKDKSHLKHLGKGHEYGWGRSSEAHEDKRNKRRRTRSAEKRQAVKEGW